MPDPHKIREHKQLRHFGAYLINPNLWHLNRSSVAGAFSVGLFCAMLPIPFQMIAAALLAIMARVNLPISVGLVWVTNPVTMPPIFYGAYRLGAWILDQPLQNIELELSVDWLLTSLGDIWAPLLLGSLTLGIIFAVLGNLLIRWLWRAKVIKRWDIRKERHKLKKTARAADTNKAEKTDDAATHKTG